MAASRSCACTSDTWHGRRDRGRLHVEEADGGRADEHELAGKLLRRSFAFEDVLGGDVTSLVVAGVVYPDTAIAVRRQLEPGHRDAAYPCLVGADQNRARAGGNPQQGRA